MASRLDPIPLFHGVIDGLRHRNDDKGEEKPDWVTRLTLAVIPLSIAILMVAFRLSIAHPDQLLAGAALLSGALLTGFSQVAAWRERILLRDEQARIRALDEAGAHILSGLLATILITALVVTLTVLPDKCIPEVLTWIRLGIGAIAIGLLTYVGITLFIVTNLLWDAFKAEHEDARRESLQDLPDEK